MKVIFVTERPTQIITALALCESFGAHWQVQIIVANCFYDAPTIVGRLSETEGGLNIRLAATYDEAIKIVESELPAHLFIHWDVGLGTQRRLQRLMRANQGQKISVFEEGIGTYRQDIYPPLKKRIFRLLGLPVNVGGSKYVDDIYVYDREEYVGSALVRPQNVVQIYPQLCEMLAKREAQFAYIFSCQWLFELLKASNDVLCTIYLSNWNFSESDLVGRLPENGVKVLKLHPHCQVCVKSKSIIVAPNSLPAELLVMSASRIFDVVVVHHKNSSVPRYVKNKNVKFINEG